MVEEISSGSHSFLCSAVWRHDKFKFRFEFSHSCAKALAIWKVLLWWFASRCVLKRHPVNTEDEVNFRQNIHKGELCLHCKRSITYAPGKIECITGRGCKSFRVYSELINESSLAAGGLIGEWFNCQQTCTCIYLIHAWKCMCEITSSQMNWSSESGGTIFFHVFEQLAVFQLWGTIIHHQTSLR